MGAWAKCCGSTRVGTSLRCSSLRPTRPAHCSSASFTTSVWSYPQAAMRTLDPPKIFSAPTSVGTSLSLVSPRPRWPEDPKPQAHSAPCSPTAMQVIFLGPSCLAAWATPATLPTGSCPAGAAAAAGRRAGGAVPRAVPEARAGLRHGDA
jgi:hypothetical protein